MNLYENRCCQVPENAFPDPQKMLQNQKIKSPNLHKNGVLFGTSFFVYNGIIYQKVYFLAFVKKEKNIPKRLTYIIKK